MIHNVKYERRFSWITLLAFIGSALFTAAIIFICVKKFSAIAFIVSFLSACVFLIITKNVIRAFFHDRYISRILRHGIISKATITTKHLTKYHRKGEDLYRITVSALNENGKESTFKLKDLLTRDSIELLESKPSFEVYVYKNKGLIAPQYLADYSDEDTYLSTSHSTPPNIVKIEDSIDERR